MYKPEKFWDRFAKRYNKSPVSNEAVYQTKLEKTREYLTPASEVLEFGCGTGTTAVSHAPFAHHIHAIDVSEKMLAFGRDKALTAQASNVTFTRADITNFQNNGEQYDVIMGHSILHLLEDKAAVIARVYDLLKPEGYFVSSTVVFAKNHPFLKFALGLGKNLGLLPLVKFFGTDELVNNITSAGFEIDHQWQPDGGDAVFIVAQKTG